MTDRLTAGGLLALLIVAGAAGSTRGDDHLPVASSGPHLWFVQPAGGSEASPSLCYHNVEMKGPWYQRLMVLARDPEGLAAWRDRLWLVFAPEGDRAAPAPAPREVFTVRVRPRAAGAGYGTVPNGRLRLLAALPGEGELAALVATRDGPMALLMPRREDGRRLREREGVSDEAGPGFPVLLRLVGREWQPAALPEDFPPDGVCLLGAGGVRGESLTLLREGRDSPGSGRAALYTSHDRGPWTCSELDLAGVRSLLRLDGQVVAAVTPPDDRVCHLLYLRPERALRFSTFRRPHGVWSATGVKDGVRVVSLDRQAGGATIRDISPITGEVSEAEVMTPLPPDLAALLQLVLLLTAVVLALVVAAAFRPAIHEAVHLPAGVRLLPPGRRLAALLIDLVPGGLLAMLLLDSRLTDLAALPLLTATLEQSGPFSLAAVIAVVHGTVTEMGRGRTLGKWVVGGRVQSVEGTGPPAGRLLVRSALKLITLLLPPLAVIVVVGPNFRGVHDLVGRTVVVEVRSGRQEGETGG